MEHPPRGDQALSRRLVLLMAIACGSAAANLYYAQPLLHTLGHAFGVAEGTAGLLVTVTQLGYVAGLALLVPIGYLRERRGLISGTLLVTAAGLAAAAAAPGLVAIAVVGTVMSGLLIGILVARTASGLIAAADQCNGHRPADRQLGRPGGGTQLSRGADRRHRAA